MVKIKNLLAPLFLVGALAVPLSGGFAQEKNTQNQDTQENAKSNPEDNWLKICDTLKSGEKACILRQVVLAGATPLGAFMIRDDPSSGKRRYRATAELPLSVLLPYNSIWQIDNTKPIRVPFILCTPRYCKAELVINESYISALKKGAKLTLLAKNLASKDLKIEIDLNGFTAVYDGDKYLTPKQFQDQQSGQGALEQQLQDVAEKLRKQKEGGGDVQQPQSQTQEPPTTNN